MMGLFSSLCGFGTTADGLWADVEESYYCSGLAEASLINMPKRSENGKKVICSE